MHTKKKYRTRRKPSNKYIYLPNKSAVSAISTQYRNFSSEVNRHGAHAN